LTAPDAAPKRPHTGWQLAVLTVVAIALVAGFVGLGVWQIQRRAWKLDLIQRVSQRLLAPAVAIPPPAQWPTLQAEDYEYLHVHLQGHWRPDKTVLTQATTALGQGFWVLTPLQQADDTVVLVNRGFVPQSQRKQWTPPLDHTDPTGLVTVHGLLRKTEPAGGFLRHNDPAAQKWYSRDVAAIASAQDLSGAAPFFVDAGLPDPTIDANSETSNVNQGTWPRQGLTVVRFSNSHAIYAMTWFALALMVVGASGLVARYERRLRLASNNRRHEDQP
jgi:surfeit locus 1 family protein